MSDILLTIRLVESGNDYTIGKNRGGASGAYQYIDSTWNGYQGYPSAYLAPPEVQDERAFADVSGILAAWGGDVSMVPVIWYYPAAARDPSLMDQVPKPWAGNRLTVREYQYRWLDMLEFVTGAPLGWRLSLLPPAVRFLSGIPPELGTRWGPFAEIAFPVLGKALVAPPAPCAQEATGACAAGAPAIVYGRKLQPILAAADGVVTAVEPGDAVSGAVTVTITDVVGRTYRYAGLNDDGPDTDDGQADRALQLTALAEVGRSVRAGQIIGFMGDTDPMPAAAGAGEPATTGPGEPAAVWPHLRLTIHDRFGNLLDADALVVAAQRRQACQVGIGPWSVPAQPDGTGATSGEATPRADVDVPAALDGGWTIHADGTVTARGASTLILPPEGCAWTPAGDFGPGAGGSAPPAGWEMPVEIPARYFVAGSRAAAGSPLPAAPLRR